MISARDYAVELARRFGLINQHPRSVLNARSCDFLKVLRDERERNIHKMALRRIWRADWSPVDVSKCGGFPTVPVHNTQCRKDVRAHPVAFFRSPPLSLSLSLSVCVSLSIFSLPSLCRDFATRNNLFSRSGS